VALVGADGGRVAELLRLRRGDIPLGLPVGVRGVVDDDRDEAAVDAPALSAVTGVGRTVVGAAARSEAGRRGADAERGEEVPAIHGVFLSWGCRPAGGIGAEPGDPAPVGRE